MTTCSAGWSPPRSNARTAQKETLDDFEIAGFATLLGGAGAETVTKLIGNAAVTFAQNPDQWQKLLDDRSKIPAAVEELLRYEAPAQYNVRRSMREVALHGVTIPAGKPVFLLGGSANRDPEAFTDADTFDIDRDRTEAQNLGFGYGVHSCLGAALARMESAIALERLLDFMPRYEVTVGRLQAGGHAERRGLVPRPGASAELANAFRPRTRRFSRRVVLGTHDRRTANRWGMTRVAVDLPGHGARVDEESTLANRRDAIVSALQPGDVCWSGIPAAGSTPRWPRTRAPDLVSHIVYVAAALPREGRTYPEAMAMRDGG